MEDVPSPPDPQGRPPDLQAESSDLGRDPSDPQGDPSGRQEGSLLGAGAIGFLTLGVAVAVSLVLGGAIGYLVDGWAGTSPLFTLLGLAFGIVIATLITINRVRTYL
jgi:hypothetical protein